MKPLGLFLPVRFFPALRFIAISADKGITEANVTRRKLVRDRNLGASTVDSAPFQ
jgi:hypothetical protein